MNEKKGEIKKMWARLRIERAEWQEEEDIIHRWSVLSLKIGSFLLAGIVIIRIIY